jgi:predicted nucleotidyltransferase
MDILNLERLSPHLRERLKGYLEEFLKIHEGNIVSIILYGSATGEEFIPKRSDINLLIIFKEIDPPDLKKTIPIVERGGRERIAAPLCLTERHIKRSVDVFPIEFLELKENHLLLFGKDLLQGIEVEKGNLRFVVEEQLKGKLIRLRQAYLEIGGRPKELISLIIETFTTLMPVLRNMLRLKGIIPPVSKEEVIDGLRANFGIDEGLFLRILRIKKGEARPTPKEIEFLFGGFVEEIERLAIEIDRLVECNEGGG